MRFKCTLLNRKLAALERSGAQVNTIIEEVDARASRQVSLSRPKWKYELVADRLWHGWAWIDEVLAIGG
jgi:hypothetical protein